MKFIFDSEIRDKLFLVKPEKYGVKIKGSCWLERERTRKIPIFETLDEAKAYFPEKQEYAKLKLKQENEVFGENENKPLDTRELALKLIEIPDREYENYLAFFQANIFSNASLEKFPAEAEAYMVLSSTPKGAMYYSPYDFALEAIFEREETAKKFQKELDKEFVKQYDFSTKTEIMSLSELKQIAELQRGE